MDQVYEMHLWGKNGNPFYSGEGSHRSEIIDPYIKAVTSFLKSFEEPLVVCDLGCGDFNVGKHFVKFTKNYIAVDVVEELINYNKQNFKANNLEFQCLDLATDHLPAGDCAILRQVLQHLSNREVQHILDKLSNFKYVILTEHVPKGQFKANKDIISGQGTRLKKQSGLQILDAPFNFVAKSENTLSTVTLEDDKGIIVTTLFEIS